MGALDLIRKGAKGIKNSPFFSKADVVLDELQRNKGTGDEFLTEIVKKGAKPTELKERGIEKALKGKPKMTKAEVQKVFEQKAPPKVQEKVLTSDAPDYEEFLEAKAQEIYGVDWFDLNKDEKKKLDKMFSELPLTQYDKYKTPGGENYREILLKLPAFDDKRLMELEAQIRREETAYRDPMQHQWFRDKVAEVQRLKEEKAAAGTPYTSSHYRDDPNLLAHIRVQDFKTPEGKKVLLVDEVQSDWHQEGRKKGYREGAEPLDPIKAQRVKDKIFERFDAGEIDREQRNALLDELSQAIEVGRRPPDAPFKKNWHELAMKRVLDYAAENGYDTVAITPGAEQAKRYDLSKQVQQIMASKEDGGVRIFARDNQGKNHDMGVHAPETLDAVIGKDLAEKVSAQTKPTDIYEGVDLQVGGEGMKGFYDKILPDYLNNYGKKYGAQVSELDLITKPEVSTPQIAAPGIGHFPEPLVEPAQTLRAHSFDITPQMREEIKTKGQPMYGKVAMPVLEGMAAGTGAATMGSQMFDENNEQSVQNPVHFTENPDAMLLELMQRN